jgi:hypothetical protein
MFVINVLLTGLLAGGAAQDGRISGRLIDDNTGASVANESVTLVSDAGLQGAQRVFTDKDGRYVFEGVASGSYRLMAIAPLRSGQLPAEAHVELSPQQRLGDIDLHFRKGASIAGRVFDPAGHPIRATIRVLGPLANGAAPVTRELNANEAGEFLADFLPPGAFYIVATAPPAAQLTRTRLVTTYYPGTPDRAAAQEVSVTVGASVTGVVFAVPSVPAFRVSGLVVDENGKTVPDVDVLLTADSRTPDPIDSFHARSRSGVDGRFAFEDVAAGTYRASVSTPPIPGGAGASAAGPSARVGVTAGIVGGVVAGIAGQAPGAMAVSSSASGRIEPPAPIAVTDADVSDVRVVVRR